MRYFALLVIGFFLGFIVCTSMFFIMTDNQLKPEIEIEQGQSVLDSQGYVHHLPPKLSVGFKFKFQ